MVARVSNLFKTTNNQHNLAFPSFDLSVFVEGDRTQ